MGRMAVGLVFAALLSSGCDPEPSSDGVESGNIGELGALYLDYIDLLNAVDRHFCGCSVKAGNYEDTRECVAAVGGLVVPQVLAQCYAEVLDGLPASQDYVQCQFSEYMQYLDCLQNVGCGGDVASCQASLGDADCPPLPYAANAALAETCLGYEMPPAFVCADGTEIVPWNECNFWPDCPDASDEHGGCPEGYQCKDSKMVPKSWVCDGASDCPAGDDELDCE